MSETWYEVAGWSDAPKPVGVERYTKNSVWLARDPSRRVSRESAWMWYYPSVTEAYERMIKNARDKADELMSRSRSAVERAGKLMQEAERLTQKMRKIAGCEEERRLRCSECDGEIPVKGVVDENGVCCSCVAKRIFQDGVIQGRSDDVPVAPDGGVEWGEDEGEGEEPGE
jgi:TFIIF-interacting CTD phosphatase-like protein